MDGAAMKRVTSYSGASGDVRTRVEIGAVRYGRKTTNKRLLATLLACVVAVMVAIAVAATAHGQGVVSPQPWCQVSAPQPQTAEGRQMQCMQPRAFLPLVMEAK
jgi:hypothetical protein